MRMKALTAVNAANRAMRESLLESMSFSISPGLFRRHPS
jgi:hypothetical protein